jgi:hypothetical protein
MTDQPPKTDIWGRKLRPEPQPVEAFLDALLAKVTTPAGSIMVRLAGDWDEVAGPPWAGTSRPVGITKGVLVVAVPDGATASLLRFQLAALRTRLNQWLGADTVEDVRLRVDRSRGAAK